MPPAALDCAAAAPTIHSFLFEQIDIAFLTDLTATQLNTLYDRLDWIEPA